MIKVILPAYNEEKSLPELFSSFIDLMEEDRFNDLEIFLINDGSSDSTRKIAEGFLGILPLSIIDHKRNEGLGVAVRTGFKAALKDHDPHDIFVVLDADNTHDPAIISKLIDKIKEGYDIVIASRYAPGGREIGLSFLRRGLSKSANLLLKAFFPIKGVYDYTCGFRAYKSIIVKKGFDVYNGDLVKGKGFTCMAEILIKLNALGAKTVEVPLILRYDLKKGKSKIKILKTIAGYVSLICGNKPVILKDKP